MNLLRVAFTYEEHDGGGIRRGVIRQTFQPVFVDSAAFGNCIDVIGQRKGHHVGFNTVDHRGRLFAGAAVGLTNHHVVAGFLLPVGAKSFVVLFVQLARRIVRNV